MPSSTSEKASGGTLVKYRIAQVTGGCEGLRDSGRSRSLSLNGRVHVRRGCQPSSQEPYKILIVFETPQEGWDSEEPWNLTPLPSSASEAGVSEAKAKNLSRFSSIFDPSLSTYLKLSRRAEGLWRI